MSYFSNIIISNKDIKLNINSNIKDKIIGSLLLGCCGDVLGSQTEGKSYDYILDHYDHGYVKNMKSKKYTDDTEMTLVLLRHITKHNDVLISLHKEFAQEAVTNKRGYSSSTMNIFKNIIKHNNHESHSSTHNGSVMRISPLGLYPIKENENLKMNILKALYTTHSHVESICSAFVLCKILNGLITNRFSTKYELIEYILKVSSIHPELYSKMKIVVLLLKDEKIYNITKEISGNKNLFQIRAIDCLVCAMYSFLKFIQYPADAIIYSASYGGDTDTIAKVTGDLVGALYGTDIIPETWLEDLEGKNELVKLGTKLSELY